MKKLSAANLCPALTLLLLALSFSFGCHNYSEARDAVISDLNQALQHTVMKHSSSWMSRDSIQTYSKLQAILNGPVSLETTNRDFTDALSFHSLKKLAGIRIQIKKKDNQTFTDSQLADGYLSSDTIVWLSPDVSAACNAGIDTMILSFRGYAYCPMTTIWEISHQSIPLILLFAAICSGALSVLFHYKRKHATVSRPLEDKSLITYGNLSLSCEENCFYDQLQNRLKLTPLQYALMEMFYLSSSHLLTKTDICQFLWPGKENAEETLYTLIRRLKSVLEENSNLRITTDRGRAYILEVMP